MSAFETIGGEAKLRPIIDEFVDRCFDDMMIGFMFPRNKRSRVKRFEYEHAAEHLGADVSYGGRPIQQAHGAHRIMGGQFDRRLEILRQTLVAHEVPDDIRDAWLGYHQSLRALVTGQGQGVCI